MTPERRFEKNRREYEQAARKGYPQAYRAANRDRVRANQAKYRSRSRERIKHRQEVRNQKYAARPIAQSQILDRYGSTCYLCDQPLTETTMTMDHVIPLVADGKHELENLRPACHRCNSSKGGQLWGQIQKRNPDMAERVRAAIATGRDRI